MSVLRWRALLWLTFAFFVIGCGLVQFSRGVALQTDLMALLPPTERNPLAERVIEKLAEVNGNRAVFLVGASNPEVTGKAVRLFAERLRESGVFRRLVAEMPKFDPDQITKTYAGYRFGLLSENDRSAFRSKENDLKERLLRKLHAPFRLGAMFSIEDDPFGLLDSWFSGLPLKDIKLEPEDGLLVARADGRVWGFIFGELSVTAYDSDFQERVVREVTRAENELRTHFEDAGVLRSGAVFYASAARTEAKSEMDFIGTVSTLCIVLLVYLVFRSFLPITLGLLSVGFGVLAAAVLSVSVFGEIHLITLVFGASLIGDTIDYPIQYLSARLGAGKAWDPLSGLRRIAPGLTMALLVGILGYGVLVFLPFPALLQIAAFSITGLSVTWITVLTLLPFFLRSPDSRGANSVISFLQGGLIWFQVKTGKKKCAAVAGALVVFALPGCFSIKWNDEVSLLISRSPDLMRQESRIRDLTGYSGGSQFFLVEGKTPEEVLINEENLSAKLAEMAAQGVIAGFRGISSFVPSRERQMRNRLFWERNIFSDREALRRVLSGTGLHEHVANALIEDFDASKNRFLHVSHWLKAPFSFPYRHLWVGETRHGFASIVLLRDIRDFGRLAALGEGLEGVTFVDKVGSVSRLFRSYREMGCSWLFYAVCLICIVLSARYGCLQAICLLSPALLSMALSMALFGYMGIPMTLFNILSLMLVLCAAVNYAIFMREGGVKVAATLAGVLLSAITDLLSFGLLSFSSTPALSGFGLTLLLGIGASIVLTPGVLVFCRQVES
ncbi:MAG: hypothetical protein LBD67_00045 [Candidatus Accumulibacter sp.]|jgi:predicted exporter|nr:hypothetical protein [Accumulibacter sp.]